MRFALFVGILCLLLTIEVGSNCWTWLFPKVAGELSENLIVQTAIIRRARSQACRGIAGWELHSIRKLRGYPIIAKHLPEWQLVSFWSGLRISSWRRKLEGYLGSGMPSTSDDYEYLAIHRKTGEVRLLFPSLERLLVESNVPLATESDAMEIGKLWSEISPAEVAFSVEADPSGEQWSLTRSYLSDVDTKHRYRNTLRLNSSNGHFTGWKYSVQRIDP